MKNDQRNNRSSSNIVLALPLVAVFINLLIYFLVPNYGINKITNIYPLFIFVGCTVYVGAFIASTKSEVLRRSIENKAPLIFVFSILLIVWDGLTLKSGKLPLPFFPWTDKVLNALVYDRKILFISVLHSLRLLGLGYFVGASIGFITGTLMGWYKGLSYWLMPFMRALGPIPAVTLIPIIIILFPTSFAGSVFLIALAVWFPVTLLTYSGIQNVNNAYFEVAKTLGAKEKYMILNVAIPGALPHIFLGLFQGITVACVTLIVAEMMGVKAGLGWYITWATGWAEYDKVYASLLIILLTFSGVITLLFKVRNKFLSWQKGVIKW